jgi:hypothetical protein
MVFIRYSLMTPKPRQEQRVREIIDELIRFQRMQDGFIAAYRLEPDEHAARGQIGRISIWESEEKANPVAHNQHHISLQSELRLVVEGSTHEEHAFQGMQPGEDGT